MTIKVPLRDTTMKESHQWLELNGEGHAFTVSLRGKRGELGGSETPISREVLEALVSVAPGVILKDGPLRFYKTEDDFRVSFTEMAEDPEISGFDRLDSQDLIKAIRELLGPEKHHAKKPPAKGKKAAPRKSKRTARR